MADEKKRVEYEIVVKLQAATLKTESDQVRKEVDKIKLLMKDVASTTEHSVTTIAKAFQRLPKEIVDSMGVSKNAISQATSELKQELKETENVAEGTGGLGSAFSGMGSIASFVFGSVLGITAVGALRKIVDLMKEAVTGSLEFDEALFQLEVGVRKLQRAGVDVTFDELAIALGEIDKNFGELSNLDITDLAAQAALLGGSFIQTENDLVALIEAAIGFSTLADGDAVQAVDRLAKGINKEWYASITTILPEVTKLTVETRAMADTNKTSADQLTVNERRQAAYKLIIELTSDATQDAIKYTDTYAGANEEVNAQIKNLSTSLGSELLPKWVQLKQVLADAAISLLKLLYVTQTAYIQFLEIAEAVDIFNVGITAAIKGKAEAFADSLLNIITNTENATDALLDYEQSLGDAELGTSVFGEGEDDGSLEDQFDLFAKLQKILTDQARKRRDAQIDLQRDLADIEEDGMRKREDVIHDYYETISDIDREYVQKREDALRSYNDKIEDANRKFDEKIAEENEDYREEELEREEDYQEKLLRLREEFLYSLEDSLRDRDVRQALRLKQRFDLDLKQLRRENEQEKEENIKNREEELEDIEKQRKLKLKELAIGYARKLDALRIANDREYREAEIDYTRDMQALTEHLAEQREDRLAAYDEDLVDIDQWTREKLQDLALSYRQENEVTRAGLKAIYQSMEAYFGSGGYIDMLYDYMLQSAENTSGAWMENLQPDLDDPPVVEDDPGGGGGSSPPVLPTSTSGVLPEDLINDTINVRGGLESATSVFISLSPGLKAEIIEASNNAVAVEVEKSINV